MNRLITISCFIFAFCANTQPYPQRSFDQTLRFINPGITSRKEVRIALGAPDNVAERVYLGGSSDVWEYDSEGITWISVFFEQNSSALNSIYFMVNDGAREQNLKYTLSRFSGANWKIESPEWISPHAYPDECYFIDRKLGVSVEYRRRRKEVSSIFRWNPSRQLASTNEGPPPKVCIDEKCIDAIPAREFMKTWVPCEIPK